MAQTKKALKDQITRKALVADVQMVLGRRPNWAKDVPANLADLSLPALTKVRNGIVMRDAAAPPAQPAHFDVLAQIKGEIQEILDRNPGWAPVDLDGLDVAGARKLRLALCRKEYD